MDTKNVKISKNGHKVLYNIPTLHFITDILHYKCKEVLEGLEELPFCS